MDETSQKIIDATMAMVRDKGYVATTTKDIARLAGVNECTLFRKFQNKKDIVLHGMEQEKWRGNVTPDIFQKVEWDLEADLPMFMREYMRRITPDFVNLSIGLRAPQLYEETVSMIMKVPQAFLRSLTDYLNQMEEKGKLPHRDWEPLAMTFFSATFGYTFLKASFGERLTGVGQEEYIRESAKVFLHGILQD
ncbi:TetR/AcrR family transcriptional regulator [Cuneatibacter sp. NSJ-177]|uniref:TetR/AcrR family transcriptional regulator n=1 Tax=Cuneatibacter sp. NSJ-177 TaxID=2931401 RepID=UPI001FD30E43|nr:TetR/AcrR family transcriptional regulator [Cuneatibacter sp. NSJ-177]MCJ7833977.1 TetR/AcrR family transcriptional regulator [Cuneatibacter sp. NSJ-177]